LPERIRGSAHLRAAKFGGKIYLDIGDPEWQAIEIDASGWRMIQDSPVRFRRTVYGRTAAARARWIDYTVAIPG
jgi:hypothetical protein